MTHLLLYTDGGANPNPGPGGWGVVAVRDDEVAYELSGGAEDTTNNRMELTAALEALASQPASVPLCVVTDSQYVRQGITSWIHSWRKNQWMRGRGPRKEPVKNADLWRQLDALASQRQVEWRWVKGHSGNRFNERADELASEEIATLAPATQPAAIAGGEGAPAALSRDALDVHAYVVVRFARGSGAWCVLVTGEQEHRLEGSFGPAQSANRLELEAGLALLEDTRTSDQCMAIYCGDYLRRGATEWMPNWQRAGWRTAGGDAVKNRDLWEKLAERLDSERHHFLKIDAKSPRVVELKKQLRS